MAKPPAEGARFVGGPPGILQKMFKIWVSEMAFPAF